MLDINRIPHSLEFMTEEGRVALSYIDQRKLPDELVIETTADWKQVVDAIQTLAVRGAPANHAVFPCVYQDHSAAGAGSKRRRL